MGASRGPLRHSVSKQNRLAAVLLASFAAAALASPGAGFLASRGERVHRVCPGDSGVHRSVGGGKLLDVTFINVSPLTLSVYWVDDNYQLKMKAEHFLPGSKLEQGMYPGHVLRFFAGKELILEHASMVSGVVRVMACQSIEPNATEPKNTSLTIPEASDYLRSPVVPCSGHGCVAAYGVALSDKIQAWNRLSSFFGIASL